MITPYHAKYFAHELTRQRPADGFERLSTSLFDASVDLNPHQIDAALFALRSPLTKGALIADEVGLGKTIEAGLVLCQLWAEGRRLLLVACPASLRKQWAAELEEKFHLPCRILDTKQIRAMQAKGRRNPLNWKGVTIISQTIIARNEKLLAITPWNLVVIDEAHKFKNAHRPSNVRGKAARTAFADRRKLLLTATPLQNTTMEIYGLSTVIDESLFGDAKVFRNQYGGRDADVADLRDRLKSFCHRTLRRDVVEYIPYTERHAMVHRFRASDEEHHLYEAVSAFLQRNDLYSIPARYKHLTTLIARKLLASSSIAIAGTLETLKRRMEKLKESAEADVPEIENLIQGLLDEVDDEDELVEEADEAEEQKAEEPKLDMAKLDREITELDALIKLAYSIPIDRKAEELLVALDAGFEELEKRGAPRKALIFTESVRTQEALVRFLETRGYANKVVGFSGKNSGPLAKQIYQDWQEKNANTDRIEGKRSVDLRTALIDYFREEAEIMVATEAAAEGVNMQFCAMVINYDLPWNPQRVEQRIGRCHRYGQKHDVVVVNFINERNEADRRVHELLRTKFNLFDGVFGASNEVLGALGEGIDLERRILDIMQQCRTQEEIAAAFDKLQAEFAPKIDAKIEQTHAKLFEHFDEDVHERLKMTLEGAKQHLDRVARQFWGLTKHILRDAALFDDTAVAFDLKRSPVPVAPNGRYKLVQRGQEPGTSKFLYRLTHPLGQWVLDEGREVQTPPAELSFDITNHAAKITAVEALKGQSGWLSASLVRLVAPRGKDTAGKEWQDQEWLEQSRFVFSCVDDSGKLVDAEVAEKMFNCSATTGPAPAVNDDAKAKLDQLATRAVEEASKQAEARNAELMNEQVQQVQRYTEEKEKQAQRALDESKEKIRAVMAAMDHFTQDQKRQREGSGNPARDKIDALFDGAEVEFTYNKVKFKYRTLADLKKKLGEAEAELSKRRQRVFEIEDEMRKLRRELIDDLERRTTLRSEIQPLFTVRWNVV